MPRVDNESSNTKRAADCLTGRAFESDQSPAASRLHVIGSRFDGFCKNGTGYKALCPVHDDSNPSLSISEGDDGRVLLNCFAGCAIEEVLAARDLTVADLFPGRPMIAATYDYQDENGELLYQSVRYDPKSFKQRAPDGNGGWTWKLDGVRRVLYRLPKLIASKSLVFVVEGEKDADRLASIGLTATTNSGGAAAKWKPEYGEALRGRHVVIFPDNDGPGRTHAAKVAAALHGIAASVKIIALPDLPAKGDVSDWLDAGGTRERLMALVKNGKPAQPPEAPAQEQAPEAGVAGIDALDLKSEITMDILESLPVLGREGYIIKRLSNVLSAAPKAGKSSLIYQCTKDWLANGETILYLSEEPKLVWHQRLNDLDIIDERGLILVFALGMQSDDLLERVRNGDESVVVVDTLRGLGILGDDENDNSGVARALEPWLTACREGNKTLVALHHDRKAGGTHGRGVSGAHALVGAVDVILQLGHGLAGNQRTLSVLSRLSQPDKLTYARLDDGTLSATGGAAEPQLVGGLTKLPAKPPGWTVDDLVRECRMSKPDALSLLAVGKKTGLVVQTGEGKKGDPKRYHRR